VAWSHKFTDEETTEAPGSWLWERDSRVADLASRVAVVEFLPAACSSRRGCARERHRSKKFWYVTARRWTKTNFRCGHGCGDFVCAIKYLSLLVDADER